MTKILKNLKKIDYFGKLIQFFSLVHIDVTYRSGLSREMASGWDRGLLRTQKWQKKDLKMNCFQHAQKLMKNNENFSSSGQFFHSYRLSGVQGADNYEKFNPGIKNRPRRGRNNDQK